MTVDDADIPVHVLWSKRNWLIVPEHPPAGQVHTTPPADVKVNPEMRYSLEELPLGNPNVVPPPEETVHTLAHMKVIPFESEGVIVEPPQLYEPAAKVTVAPSLALLTTLLTSETEAPAGHDQLVPLPVQAACAGIAESTQIIPKT